MSFKRSDYLCLPSYLIALRPLGRGGGASPRAPPGGTRGAAQDARRRGPIARAEAPRGGPFSPAGLCLDYYTAAWFPADLLSLSFFIARFLFQALFLKALASTFLPTQLCIPPIVSFRNFPFALLYFPFLLCAELTPRGVGGAASLICFDIYCEK